MKDEILYSIAELWVFDYLFVCLLLHHGLTTKPRDAIFGMHTHLVYKSKIGYVTLTSEVIRGHLRSKTVNWGNWDHNLKKLTQWCIFCICTHITPRSNIGYVNLTSNVITGHWRSKLRGHWRSKIANWAHSLMPALRYTIFCMYSHMTYIDIWIYTILTLEVIRGHLRSKTSIWGHVLMTSPSDAFVCMFIHMKHRSTIGYVSLTSEVIRGHWRSNWGQIEFTP